LTLNRPAIVQFIGHFESQVPLIEAVQSPHLRKVLYATAMGPLARAAYGSGLGNRARFVKMIENLAGWKESTKISLPQLALTLSAKKRGRHRLARHVRIGLAEWGEGNLMPLSVSPNRSEVLPFADPAEEKYVDESKYSNLFYAYRNSLVHEFRQPGYGMEFPRDVGHPYYMSVIDGPWELVFPTKFFATLYVQTLEGLRHHLVTGKINPYHQFDFGSRWHNR
jgi:hypothetical protein